MPQIKLAKVISYKMPKTVVVEIQTKVKHPLYKKLVSRTSRFKVHDDLGVQLGQTVKIVETRPISKDVHFKVLEVAR